MVAFDRAIKDAERYSLPAPLDEWRALRQQIHTEVCERGYDGLRNTFVQSCGSDQLDVGLLAEEDDPVARRMVGNFPQAFSHLSLIGTAFNLAHANKPAEQRSEAHVQDAGSSQYPRPAPDLPTGAGWLPRLSDEHVGPPREK